MLKDLIVIVLPDPRTFGFLIIMSVVFVTIGFLHYVYYLFKVSGAQSEDHHIVLLDSRRLDGLQQANARRLDGRRRQNAVEPRNAAAHKTRRGGARRLASLQPSTLSIIRLSHLS